MPRNAGLKLAICVQDLGQVEYVLSDKTGALSLIVHARLRMFVPPLSGIDWFKI